MPFRHPDANILNFFCMALNRGISARIHGSFWWHLGSASAIMVPKNQVYAGKIGRLKKATTIDLQREATEPEQR